MTGSELRLSKIEGDLSVMKWMVQRHSYRIGDRDPGIAITSAADGPLSAFVPRWRNGEYSASCSILCSTMSRSRSRNAATARRKPGSGIQCARVGRHRQIAALQFMRPLRPGLDPLQPAPNREFDRLVVAAFEMQKAVFAVGAPVAAIDRVASQNIKRAGDVILAAPRHEQHDLVRHALAEHREKPPRQIGRAPFAVRRAEIEAVKRVPGPLGQV